MTSLEINPQGIDEEYLANLNLSFGNWGNKKTFDWYFRRKTAFPDSDLIVLRKDGRMVAGSGLTYRIVALPGGSEIIVGIMTGSWTHPEFRRRGLFGRIIQKAVEVTSDKSGALWLGFVVDDSSSFRQCAKAGAAFFPTSYNFSTAKTLSPEANASQRFGWSPVGLEAVPALYECLKDQGKGYVHFVYPSEVDFKSQFLQRAGQTEILYDGEGNFAVIEIVNAVERVQLLLPKLTDEGIVSSMIVGLLARARASNRELFIFSTSTLVDSICRGLGFGCTAGQLAVITADRNRLGCALNLSESRLDNCPLAAADQDCFLGQWRVHGGDRA